MTKSQIIEQLFTGKNFNDCIRKMEPEHLQDDLRMEVIAIVCEWSEEKIVGLYSNGGLDYYVVRVILNLIKSNTSPFYRTYRRYTSEFDDSSHTSPHRGGPVAVKGEKDFFSEINDKPVLAKEIKKIGQIGCIMFYTAEVQSFIVSKLEKINKIKDLNQRRDEYTAFKDAMIRDFVDQMDDIGALVDLRGPRKQTVRSVENQISMSFWHEAEQDTIDKEALLNLLASSVQDLYWYDREMIELYLKVGNFRAMEKATGIPHTTCFKTVQKVFALLKQKVQ